MATTEEVTILVKAVGDASGLQPVTNAIQQTQNLGRQSQQTLNAQQQAVNQMLRQSMQGQPQTLSAFSRELERVAQATTIRPTLLPADFGIRATQAAAAARTTATAVEEVGRSANVTGGEVLRMGAAFVGAGVGLSAFTAVGQGLHDLLAGIVTQTIAMDQAMRLNTAVLGQQGPGFQSWSQQISQSLGVTQQSLVEAGTGAEIFRRQIGASPESVQQLTLLATALGQIRGSSPAETMSLLTSAMQGNAQAAQTLGLQLDSAYLAYTQLGGATADVFNALDPAAQATLRYAAATEQARNQVGQTTGPVQELQRAQDQLNKAWETFARTYGPGVTGMLAGIIGKAGDALDALNKLNNWTIERNKQSGANDPVAGPLGLGKNEMQALGDAQSAVTQWQQRVGQGMDQVGQEARTAWDFLTGGPGGPQLSAIEQQVRVGLGSAIGTVTDTARQFGSEFNNQLGQVGVRLQQTAADVLNVGQALSVSTSGVADAADRARQSQLGALARQAGEPIAAGQAALRNEMVAVQELDRLKQNSLNLTADEAAIRLQMLPAQERMTELQLQANAAQIEATQRSLPAARALEDLQGRIQRDQLVASSGARSAAERTAAAREGAALLRTEPEAQIAALDARLAAVPAARRVQDVGLEAQQLGITQQQAVQGLEYQRQQTGFLQQIAEAAYASAARTFNLSIQAVNAVIQSSGLQITEQDIQQIGAASSAATVAAFHIALGQVDGRSASNRLLAGGTG